MEVGSVFGGELAAAAARFRAGKLLFFDTLGLTYGFTLNALELVFH